jgi:hypothetical protein
MAAILGVISGDDHVGMGVSDAADTRVPLGVLAETGKTGCSMAVAAVPRRSGMNPSTSLHLFHRRTAREGSGTAWAAIIAVLFATVAAISFAVDQSVALSTLPPATQSTGR